MRTSEGFFFHQARESGHHLDRFDTLKALEVAVVLGKIAYVVSNDADLGGPVEA